MTLEKISNFGEFEFHKGFFISRIYEGVNAEERHIKPLSDLLLKHYSGDPIVYVVDRVNSFSISLFATKRFIELNNICYIAIVTHSDLQKFSFSFEKQVSQMQNVFLLQKHQNLAC